MDGPAGILAGPFFVEQAAGQAHMGQKGPGAAAVDEEIFAAAAHAFQGLAGQGRLETVGCRIPDEPGQVQFDGRDGLAPDVLVEEGPYRFYFR